MRISAGAKVIMQSTKFINKTTVHFVLPAILSIFGLIVSLFEVYDFKPNVWDFGLFINVMWNFASGNGWLMSFYDGIRPVTNFLADHFDLLSPVFSWLLKIFPSPYTYSCLHSLAFAAIFFLVPCLARELYKQAGKNDYLKPAVFLLLTTSMFPGIIGAWRYQSHSTTLAMPFLLAALLFLHQKKHFLAVICCFIVAMAQERATVAVFGVGMYAVLILKQYRLGTALCVFSAGYFFLLVKVVIPWFAGSNYMYSSSLAPFFEPWKKIYFLFKFMAGWMFLLCFGKRAFFASLCAMPIIAIGLVSSRQGMYSFSHHYHDLPSMFMIAGALLACYNYKKRNSSKKSLTRFAFLEPLPILAS